jgi:hypothetical protein
VDQIVGSFETPLGFTDTTAPQVTAAITEHVLNAVVSDDFDKVPVLSGVSVQMDGKNIPFTYDEKTGMLSAQLTVMDTNAHRVTVTAKDASGNLGRASCDMPAAGTEVVFADTAGYWAETYVNWLKTTGITNGFEDGTFRPDQTITRQQFAVMLYRYLGLDGSQYESLELPFADNEKIGAYAETAVKALYSLGILTGTPEGEKLYFQPEKSLSRAQAAAMIGRTQNKGYALSPLGFSDGGEIPPYAGEYIQSMITQGIISGYDDGTFRPSRNITRGQMGKILYQLV